MSLYELAAAASNASASTPGWAQAIAPVASAALASFGTWLTVRSNSRTSAGASVNAARDSFADDLQAELKRRDERVATLETQLAEYRTRTDARIEQQDAKLTAQAEQIATLSAEVHARRTTDALWRRWFGLVVVLWAEGQEQAIRHGYTLADLPPSPALD